MRKFGLLAEVLSDIVSLVRRNLPTEAEREERLQHSRRHGVLREQ